MRRWAAGYQEWECLTVSFCYPANRQLTLGCYVEDSEFPRPGGSGRGGGWSMVEGEGSQDTSSEKNI